MLNFIEEIYLYKLLVKVNKKVILILQIINKEVFPLFTPVIVVGLFNNKVL